MNHSKRHNYLVLDKHSAGSDARRCNDDCVISRESLGSARMLLDCIDKRASYRLENCCRQYANISASRKSAPKIHSLTHQERASKPLDSASFVPAQPSEDRHTICFVTGCVIHSHHVDIGHDSDKDSLHQTPGVFIVKETLTDSSACTVMKAPMTMERFIHDVSEIMQRAQPGSCNDFATSRLALLDLEFSHYR